VDTYAGAHFTHGDAIIGHNESDGKPVLTGRLRYRPLHTMGSTVIVGTLSALIVLLDGI
jgi:hypothetical protein